MDHVTCTYNTDNSSDMIMLLFFIIGNNCSKALLCGENLPLGLSLSLLHSLPSSII